MERSEGKIPLGRSRRGWKDNIKWIFRKWIGGHRLNWFGLEHGGMAGSFKGGDEPSGTIKCG